MLAIMIVKAGGQDPQSPTDPALVRAEDEIDMRMKQLLDLALPEWPRASAKSTVPDEACGATMRWS